jgi:hypothetical protein
MAAKRRGWKYRKLLVLALLAVGVGPVAGPRRSDAATTQRIVVDRHTGIAIGGFDPMAYFTDRLPMSGRAEFEYSLDGAVWRFANEGNRAAFIEHPEIYRPRFGGYDPTAVGRGVAVPGNPMFWLIFDDKLYLFLDQETWSAFLADSAAMARAAEARWPDVERSLAQ